MTEVRYVFGRRQSQDLPGYPSGPCNPFVFTVTADAKPHSWDSAYALLGFYRDEFIKACCAASTSSQMSVIEGREIWIPTCYLDQPTIEVVGEGCTEELLLNGDKPNPWLSLSIN